MRPIPCRTWSGGNRVRSVETRPESVNTTNYLYDGKDVIIKHDDALYLKKRYNRIKTPGGIGGILSMTKPNGNSFYYHYDDIGSVVNLTNKNGVEVVSAVYDPYGRKVSVDGTWKGNQYRYSSKEWEAHAGLYYYGARYYDPQVGRWLTPDPKGFIDGPNLYAFVGNNPVNYVDPWGYCGEKKEVALYLSLMFHPSIKIGDQWYHFAPESSNFISEGEVLKTKPPFESTNKLFNLPNNNDYIESLTEAISYSEKAGRDYNAISYNCWNWTIETLTTAYFDYKSKQKNGGDS